jgi:uncharacterized protein
MPLTPDILRAYEEALYEAGDGLVLRIGEANAALERLMREHHAETAAFVTAANPHGMQRSRPDSEPSVLLLGIPRAEAIALGRRLEQNAIVFVERGGAPELVLMRPMRLVLDTQVWLDWLVFDDPSVAALRGEIERARAEVVIDAAGLAELERVLGYPLGRRTVDAAACLAACQKIATRVEVGTGAVYRLPLCRDPDDQKFLTLAAGARADCLVSRDRELLRLNRSCSPWLAIVPPRAFGPRPVK